MRKVTLLILSLASGTVGGLLWIAAQTREAAVDQRLCRLVGKFLEGRYPEPVPADCLATGILADLAGWLILLCPTLLALIVISEAYSRLNEYTRRKAKLTVLKPLDEDGPEETFWDGKELKPDLRLKNLFFYVNPDCFGDSGKNALRTGDDLLNKLYRGKVTAWGRANVNGLQQTLTRIPSEYWAHATFDYSFFCDDAGIQTEPLPGHLGPSYSDVQFNREQVKSVWPTAPHAWDGYGRRLLSIWQRLIRRFITPTVGGPSERGPEDCRFPSPDDQHPPLGVYKVVAENPDR
jgi:hypothetical protein